MEHRYLTKALNAVFKARPNVLEEMIANGTFCTDLLQNTGCYSAPFPIYMITKCWEELVKPEKWKEQYRGKVYDAINRNNRIKNIWKERFGVDIDTLEINVSDYLADMYSDFPFSYLVEVDNVVREMTFQWEADDRIALFNACYTYNFKEAERLLKNGGDAMWIYNIDLDDYCTSLIDIVSRYSDLVSDDVGNTIVDGSFMHSKPTIGMLVESVALKRMVGLLEKYGGKKADDDEEC